MEQAQNKTKHNKNKTSPPPRTHTLTQTNEETKGLPNHMNGLPMFSSGENILESVFAKLLTPWPLTAWNQEGQVYGLTTELMFTSWQRLGHI